MRILFLLVALSLAFTAVAQDTPKTMTKIVAQMDGPDVAKDAFIRKPKVMYRAGNRYCRIEEAMDEAQGFHLLAIVNEPDAWMVNLASKTGKHIIDPGPTLNCHLPIFSGPIPDTSDNTDYANLGLEFGKEIEFFERMGASPQPGPVLQTKQTTSYTIEIGGTRLALFIYGPDKHPLLVGRTNGKKGELCWFSGYGQLAFDPKLFSKPEGVTVEEPKK